VVAGISNKEGPGLATSGTQRDGFRWEFQVTGNRFGRHVRSLTAVQGAFGVMFFDELIDQRVQARDVAFPGQVRDNIPLGIDNDQGGPGACGISLPGDQFGVIEDGVGDVVTFDGRSDRFSFGFVIKFWGVHADGDQHIGVFGFQRAQLIQHV
jgi:hypothetical protein